MILSTWALAFTWLPNSPEGFVTPKLLIAMAAVAILSAPASLRRQVAACAAAMAASWWFSIDPAMSFYGNPESRAYGVLAMLLGLTILGISAARPVAVEKLAWVGVAVAVHAILQRAGLDPIIRELPGGRAVGYLGSPIDLGAFLAILITVSNQWQAAVIAAGLVAAGSRGAMFAAACGLAARLWPRASLFIMAASFLVMFAPAKEAKDIARHELWRSALGTFVEHPLLGAGPSTFFKTFDRAPRERHEAIMPGRSQAQAHNDILCVAGTMGLAGLAAYLWLLFSLPLTPALVALFASMKMNPVSLEVFALAAIIAGSSIHRRETI